MTAIPLQLGVEIEVIVRGEGEGEWFLRWLAVARKLRRELRERGIPSHITGAFKGNIEAYAEWSLTPDITVKSPNGSYRDMELISPLWPFDPQSVWRGEIQTVWEVLEARGGTATNETCSTHVHVSPSEAVWTLDQLKKLAIGTVYFEAALDTLMPLHRVVKDHHCRSIRERSGWKDRTLAEIAPEIQHAASVRILIDLMSQGIANRLGRRFRWNFRSLIVDKGVEFRQPPGSANAVETQAWVELTLAFVSACLACPIVDPEDDGTPEQLQAFLVKGAETVGIDDTTIILGLFSGNRA